MTLQLEQLFFYESEKEIRCDASELFFSNPERKELQFTHNEVVSLFYARHSTIHEKDKVIFIEVLDTETGELMHLNCRRDMHDLMVKYMLYPPIIKNLFL